MITQEIIQKAKELALNEINIYGYPNILNLETSNEKGQELAKKLNADKNIVLLGTILMDIQLGRAFKEKKPQEHVKMSVEFTNNFLSNTKLSDEIKNKIINCVESHHGTKPYICIEAEICANADCYRFIYPKNVLTFLTDNVKNGMTFEKSLKFTIEKMEEKHKILSLDICKKELEPYYQEFTKIFAKALEK